MLHAKARGIPCWTCGRTLLVTSGVSLAPPTSDSLTGMPLQAAAANEHRANPTSSAACNTADAAESLLLDTQFPGRFSFENEGQF